MNIKQLLKNSSLFLRIYYKYLRKYLYRLKLLKQHRVSAFSNSEVDSLLTLLPKNNEFIIISGVPNINRLEEFINIIVQKFPKHTLICIDNFMQDLTSIEKIVNSFYHKQLDKSNYFNFLKKIYTKNHNIYFIPLYSTLVRSNYIKYNAKGLPENIQNFFNEKPEYKIFAIEQNKCFCDAGKAYGYEYVYNAYYYILKLLQINNISKVIMMNKWTVFHKLFHTLINKEQIEVLYSEHGLIPNTFNIEKYGQMGESFPATNADEFKQIPITLQEYKNAAKLIKYLSVNRVNRYNHAPIDNFNKIKIRLTPGRPILLYAGQNDFQSGILPYDETSKKYHSPIFKTSDEAALFLYDLAKKNNWNFIYKLHPIMATIPQYIEYPKDMIVINNGNIIDLIDTCDVFVTIFSQSAYLSLINKKPVVMLGYNQLKYKECIYEAYKKENIEIIIHKAINKGYTTKQNQYFIKHIAQLIKYYSY